MTEVAPHDKPSASSEPLDIAIHTYRWNPPPDVSVRKRGIYLLHGMGEHAARYERLANRLSAMGWRVGAHDHPGHGRSGGQRGVASPRDILVTQSVAQIERFTKECGNPPILFGHSLGGVVATQLVLQQGVSVAGMMLSAPAVVPRLTLANKLKVKILGTLAPSFTVELPYDASLLTHDSATIKAAESDELIHGFKSAGLVRWLIDSAHQAIEQADQISVPTLLMIAGSDQLIDTDQTHAFANCIPSGLLTQHLYEGYYHEILNETQDRRERVMEDILHWLELNHF